MDDPLTTASILSPVTMGSLSTTWSRITANTMMPTSSTTRTARMITIRGTVESKVKRTDLVQIPRLKNYGGWEFCRLAQAARTAAQIADAVADRLASFPILN